MGCGGASTRAVSITATLVAASIVALLGIAGTAAAAKRAHDRVSIRILPPDRLIGFVTSPRTDCTRGRRVAVFKAAGPRGPKGAKRLAAVRAKRDAGGYRQWTAKTGGPGTYWVKLDRRPGCGTARSKRLRVLPGAGDDIPECYDPRAARRANESACKFPYRVHIDLKYGDTIALPCPGFGDHSEGYCHGVTDNMPEDWATGFAPHGRFLWDTSEDGRRASWNLYSSGGYLTGTLPGPGSARWSISAAGLNGDDGRPAPGPKWLSPDLPGKDPGTLGGPLYMDFRNAPWGADIFFWGYLLLGPGSG